VITVVLSTCLTIVVGLHLATVYVSMMGPVLCLWLQWRSNRDQVAAQLDCFFLRLASAALLAATILGGLAILIIARLFPDAYWAAARVLPESRYWYGAVELFFSLGCFLLALAMWRRQPISHGRFWTRWLTTLLGSSNLVYHFPTLFVMLGVLCVRPDDWGRKIRFTNLLVDAEVLSRVVHHLLAALAITGLAAAWYGARRDDHDRSVVVWGGRMAAVAILAQFLSGIWLVTAMPAETRELLLGGDALAAGLFGLSLLLAFFVVPRVGVMALGRVEPRHTERTAVLVLAIILAMTAVRHRTRELLLARQRQRADVHEGIGTK
jgi:hypothetical protein